MNTKKQQSAFTLVELLMVVAIVGILAGILIPAVSVVRKQAKVGQSKMQLKAYVTAIQSYKSAYKYYPFVSSGDEEFPLVDATNSTEFIETLSVRDVQSGERISAEKARQLGNRKREEFHVFNEKEFYVDPDTGVASNNRLADGFNNANIVVVIDADGDGYVAPTPTDGGLSDELEELFGDGRIRTEITIYVDTDPDPDGSNNPTYGIWD